MKKAGRSKSSASTQEENRRGIRLVLKMPLTILGRAKSGKDYAIHLDTINVSQRGLCILLPKDYVVESDDVFISIPGKFNARAKVRWLEPAPGKKQIRCGIELVEPYSNWVLM